MGKFPLSVAQCHFFARPITIQKPVANQKVATVKKAYKGVSRVKKNRKILFSKMDKKLQKILRKIEASQAGIPLTIPPGLSKPGGGNFNRICQNIRHTNHHHRQGRHTPSKEYGDPTHSNFLGCPAVREPSGCPNDPAQRFGAGEIFGPDL